MTREYLKGVTHCRTHGNKMPCRKCAKRFIEMRENGELEEIKEELEKDDP